MNEKDFFETFEAERWNFTLVDEANTIEPVQQVGLVAVFYLVDAFLPVRRKHIAQAFQLYDQYFGDKLKGGYREDLGMTLRDYTRHEFHSSATFIEQTSPMNAVELKWMSVAGEVRFNPRTSNLWLRRFDLPSPPAEEPTADPSTVTGEARRFLRIASGTPCPWPGVWQCLDAEHLGPQTIAYGVPLPEIDGRIVTWQLIKAL